MRAVVMKFGGSSVVDAAAIDRVARIVSAEQARGSTPVVVVSALGGVTDALLALADDARRGDLTAVDADLESLSRRHHDQARALGVGEDDGLRQALDDQIAALRSVLRGIRPDLHDDASSVPSQHFPRICFRARIRTHLGVRGIDGNGFDLD